MKRLLCLISGMNSGGAETFLMKLYRKIDRSKYQMDFCVNIKEEGFYDKEIESLGGKIYHIPSKSENLKEFKSQLTEIIKKEKYEYVLRITSNTMGFMDLKVAKNAGAKVCIARSSNSNDAEGVKTKIVHILGRILYSKYVDIKIAPSDLAAIYTFGKKAYERNAVHILKNAVDLDIFRYDSKNRESIRMEFGISDKDIVYGHIGRFSKQKNHVFLINIFADICRNKSNVRLLLVGTGELEDDIYKQCRQLGIEDKVIFAGVRTDISAILSAMDVFVFPSLYEGMPNTVIEAQATGLPCIISDTITKQAAITELISYVPLSDKKKWTDKMLFIPSVPRTDMSIKLETAGYSINEVITKFVQLIFNQ